MVPGESPDPLSFTKTIKDKMNFASSLKKEIESSPEINRRGKRILSIINSPPSNARTRKLRRMERRARQEIGESPRTKIDWSKVDWEKWFKLIFEALLKLLPLLV